MEVELRRAFNLAYYYILSCGAGLACVGGFGVLRGLDLERTRGDNSGSEEKSEKISGGDSNLGPDR